MFGVAGLWREWEGEAGPEHSFTQLTINADEHSLMRRFHKPDDEKRALVIVPQTEWDDWLGCTHPEDARSLLTHYPAEKMTSWAAPVPPREKKAVPPAPNSASGTQMGLLYRFIQVRSYSMLEVQPLLDAAHRIGAVAELVILNAEERVNFPDRVAACYCLTLLEQYNATLLLMGRGFSSHAGAPLRSMLEGLVDLRNLVANEGYVDEIILNDISENVKTWRAFASTPDLQGDADAMKELGELQVAGQRQVDELKLKGVSTKPLEQRLGPVGDPSIYSAYRFLCGVTHSRLTNVLSRHAGAILKYGEPAPQDTIIGFLKIAVMMLGLALEQVNRYYDVPEEQVYRALAEIDAIWSAALSEQTAPIARSKYRPPEGGFLYFSLKN